MADAEERAHWRDILAAFDGYMQYHLAANHARRMAFIALPKDEKELYEEIGFRDKLEAVDEGIRQNGDFIDLMIRDPVFADMLAEPNGDREREGYEHGHSHGRDGHGHGHEHGSQHEHGHQHEHGSRRGSPHNSHGGPRPTPSQRDRDLAQDKVRSTLRSFVRDWAKEGKAERDACYTPILSALEEHFPDNRGEHKVLVPGCGLGRLPMEIAARGFWSQGNEFSTYMLIASHFALNQTSVPEEHVLFPFLHSFSNHRTTGSHLLRSVRIPDVVPADILENALPGGFSLVAGDFEDVYGPSQWHDAEDRDPQGDGENVNQKGRWSAVVTCFFIDTARNLLKYLRIIHGLLNEHGVWINLGPLLWHFENSPASHKGELSLELSLDEIQELARKVGFEFVQESTVQSTYTGVPDGMLEHVYKCAFWVARKITPEEQAAAEASEEELMPTE